MRLREFETRSLAAASSIMAREWSRHEIKASGADFHMRFHHRRISPDISLGALAYGTAVEIDPTERDQVLLVEMPREGVARATYPGSEVTAHSGSYAIVDVERLSRAAFSPDFDMVVLRVRLARLTSQLEALLGSRPRRPIVFAPNLDRGTPAWNDWYAIATALTALSSGPDTVSAPALGVLEDAILSTLLVAQPNNYTDELKRPAASLAPKHVRAAERYIEAHLQDPITTRMIAEYAGVSVRALFDGFKAFRGVTPKESIRSMRLERARADLIDGQHSVSEVACKWGYSHSGHFASLYRQRFGETPVRTRRFSASPG